MYIHKCIDNFTFSTCLCWVRVFSFVNGWGSHRYVVCGFHIGSSIFGVENILSLEYEFFQTGTGRTSLHYIFFRDPAMFRIMSAILFKRVRHDVWHHPSLFWANPLSVDSVDLGRIVLETLGPHCMSGMLLTLTPQVPTDRLVVLFPNGPGTHRMGGRGARLHGCVIVS